MYDKESHLLPSCHLKYSRVNNYTELNNYIVINYKRVCKENVLRESCVFSALLDTYETTVREILSLLSVLLLLGAKCV